MWKKVEEKRSFFRVYWSSKKQPKNLPVIEKGWKGFNCSGQYPYFIEFNPNKCMCFILSSKQTDRLKNIPDFEKELLYYAPATTHGYSKYRKNQLAVVVEKDKIIEEDTFVIKGEKFWAMWAMEYCYKKTDILP